MEEESSRRADAFNVPRQPSRLRKCLTGLGVISAIPWTVPWGLRYGASARLGHAHLPRRILRQWFNAVPMVQPFRARSSEKSNYLQLFGRARVFLLSSKSKHFGWPASQ
jgi:hypothetical protein